MIVLAFDTSCNACSICLWQDGAVMVQKSELMERGQAELLIPEIDIMLKDNGLVFKDIDLIAVTKGPGSFTGIRASLATARALSLASNVPVIGVSTLQVFAEQAKAYVKTEQLIIAQESKRADLYYQVFDNDRKAKSAEKSASPAEIIALAGDLETVIFGDASKHFEFELPANVKLVSETAIIPKPEIIAELAYAEFGKNKDKISANPKDFYPNPIYIRPPDVSISINQ